MCACGAVSLSVIRPWFDLAATSHPANPASGKPNKADEREKLLIKRKRQRNRLRLEDRETASLGEDERSPLIFLRIIVLRYR